MYTLRDLGGKIASNGGEEIVTCYAKNIKPNPEDLLAELRYEKDMPVIKWGEEMD